MSDAIIPEKKIHPPVSVAMATCNGGNFLEEQILSLLSQTHQPAEIIVTDDASTDNTTEILERYSRQGALRYYRNPGRLGVIGNFKKAVSLTAEGNYIALCDQDDIWLPEKLETSLAVLQKTEKNKMPAMIYSDLWLMDRNGNGLPATVQQQLGHHKYEHCLETLLFGNFVLGCTVVMNSEMKKYFSEIPEGHNFNHDAWITLAAFCFGKIRQLDTPLIRYRQHDHNVTFREVKQRNPFNRILLHARNSFLNRCFLEEQFELVRTFYAAYKNRLTEETAGILSNFLLLENKSYVRKKLAFEAVFRQKWNRRF